MILAAAGFLVQVRVAQAIRVDVDGVRPTFPRRTTVTSLSGVLTYDARPIASELASGATSPSSSSRSNDTTSPTTPSD
jgi:hypothetical protein